MAFEEKELVYNLYPLYVGWQLLPELIIEYNTQADPSKDENQNNLLAELVERSMPKRIYVLVSYIKPLNYFCFKYLINKFILLSIFS